MAYNIIFYFSDQQRWDTCGCFGQPLNVTPNLDKLAEEGVKFDNAFSPQPVCGPCRALFQTGKYPTETGCFRNNLMLPSNIKTLGEYMEKDAGYETAYVGKWHLASDGELEKKPTIDHTITAVPLELRGGYTGYWRAADVLEFTSHGYDGYVFDENNNRIDFKGYRADCINQFALDYLDQYTGEKPFFMTVSQIEPHHQNDHNHYEGPNGSKQRFADFVLPEDLKALGGNAAEEYPDYLGQCASLDVYLQGVHLTVLPLSGDGQFQSVPGLAGAGLHHEDRLFPTVLHHAAQQSGNGHRFLSRRADQQHLCYHHA